MELLITLTQMLYEVIIYINSDDLNNLTQVLILFDLFIHFFNSSLVEVFCLILYARKQVNRIMQ